MGAGVGRTATLAMASAVLVGTSALGYGVVRWTSAADRPTSYAADTTPVTKPATTGGSTAATAGPTAGPATSTTAAPDAVAARVERQVTAPLPAARPPGDAGGGPPDPGQR